MEIQIQVFANVDALNNRNKLFERIVNVDDSLKVPYENLVRDLKFLFGQSAIVTFNVH